MLRFQVGSGSSGASVAASACCSELSVSLGRGRAFFGGRPQYSERVTAFLGFGQFQFDAGSRNIAKSQAMNVLFLGSFSFFPK